MAKEEHETNKTVQIIRGCPFPNSKRFSKKNIEDTMDYVPRDGDVVIASYPKTGTTWMQYILLQITSRGTYFPSFDDTIYKIVPFMEMVGVAAVEALVEPRMYKHHLPYNMVQKTDKSKTIYTYRHPEDTVVSYYHFIQSMQLEIELDFNEFLDGFVTGNMSYGSYFQHVLSFYEHREDLNILMVSYEKLHSNRRGEILRIAKFLGEEHYICLMEQGEILDKIIEHTSFEYMKKNLFLTHPDQKKDGEVKEENKVNFFRKGIVGDGKNILTKEQQKRIKEAAATTLTETSILLDWYWDDN